MNENEIEISVYCLAYNCVQFIDKSIHGMLNQKTKVKYKIIIHDDASNDGTAEIIKRYANKYPEKIYAILQSENQYSKGVDIEKEYIWPHIKGKYVAICEGDDYWIDENKLQFQYEYMEHHPECSLCTHNTLKYDLTDNKTKKFNNWRNTYALTPEDVFMKWYVHTSSFFLRRTCMDWNGNVYWFGDYMMLTWSLYQGKIVALPQVMSQYNWKNPNGVTYNNNMQEVNKWIETWAQLITYLNEYNELTHFKYDQYIQKKIGLVKFQCCQKEYDNIIFNSISKANSIKAAKKLKTSEYYSIYVDMKKGIWKLLRRYRYEGYFFYPLWKYIMQKYLKNDEI